MYKTRSTPPVGRSPSKAETRRAVVTAGLILLGSLIVIGVYAWLVLGPSALSATGYIALAFGIIATLGLAVGLMTLVFFSDRYGYDEDVGSGKDPDAPP